MRRRNYALGRMADGGFITPAGRPDEAKKRRSSSGRIDPDKRLGAPYFLEEVRSELEAATARSSSTRTACPFRRRSTCGCRKPRTRARRGLRRIDKRRGFRKPRRNVIAEGTRSRRSASRAGTAHEAGRHRAGRRHCRRRRRSTARRGTRVTIDRKRATRGRGRHRRRSSSRAATSSSASYSRSPTARAGRLARSSRRRTSKARCSPSTTAPARSLAMVGGYSFERSKFNRATQAYRQVGSAFKPSSTPPRSTAATRRSRC